jgi:hypothetical protein
VEVLVVDGSPAPIFHSHAASLSPRVVHLRPHPDLITRNGKVGAVLTGLRHASHERVVIADDDVRYDGPALARVVAELGRFDVVRPQNYFAPLPWHARWDTARTLLNRVGDGDWPGTLAVRRSRLMAAGGYRGDVLFENLELVRTVRAAGGTLGTPLDLYVRRLPPSLEGFLDQRVRQAYDELARPRRMAVWLSVLPLVAVASARRSWLPIIVGAGACMAAAEAGRRRAGGRRVFPATSSVLAPAWVMERAVCAWLAVGARLLLGGVRYRDGRLLHAATDEASLRRSLSVAAGGRRSP